MIVTFLGIFLVTGVLLNLVHGPVLFREDRDPLDPTLRYVFCFFRHGTRSPLNTYPKDPHLASGAYQQVFSDGPGKLTPIGKHEMYKVGKSLRRKYGRFVNEYRDDSVRVTSTPVSRTIMSALSTMAGMFPPLKPVIPGLKWQPIPVWQNTTDIDKTYIDPNGGFKSIEPSFCPKLEYLIGKMFLKLEEKHKLTPQSKQISEVVEQHTGLEVKSLSGFAQIYDTLNCEYLNGMKLPQWATLPQPGFEDKPIYPDLIRPNFAEPFMRFQYSDELLGFFSGPMLNCLQQDLRKKSENLDSPDLMWYHSTHDVALFVVLWTLRIKDVPNIGTGDGIIFELHEEEQQLTVKILYYEGMKRKTRELNSPLCPAPCLLSDFIAKVPSLTPEEWKIKCKIL